MKKIVTMALVTVLIISLAACTSQETTKDDVAYKDGTYVAEGDKWDFGYEDATVVVKDGKIKEIEFRRIDTEGDEVNYATYHGMGGPDLAKAKEELSKNMLDKQTFKVHSVSGATVSSGNWMIAVERALEKATK